MLNCVVLFLYVHFCIFSRFSIIFNSYVCVLLVLHIQIINNLTHPDQIDANKVFAPSFLSQLHAVSREELLQWTNILLSKCVSQYRRINRLTKGRDQWRNKCLTNGRLNQTLSKRVCLNKVDDLLNQLQECAPEGSDLKSSLICHYIKNDQICKEIVWKYLDKEIVQNNKQNNQIIDENINRIKEYVIQATQACFSRRNLQFIKNAVRENCTCIFCIVSMYACMFVCM